ncbi:MAG: hypothetical protein HYZ73_00755 [Elusimicrobia bacterium]|nr:hypothetical protein [Elusimicrobiota bacterium]
MKNPFVVSPMKPLWHTLRWLTLLGLVAVPPTHANVTLTAGPQEDVLKPHAFGLTDFPDGLIGVIKQGVRFYWFVGSFAPDDRTKTYLIRLVGDRLDHLKPDPMDPQGNVVPVLRPGAKGTYDDHIAGNGSIYLDEKTGTLYFWYQAMREISEEAEQQKRAVPGAYVYPAYSTIGVAVSEDLGSTWQKKGVDLQLHLPWATFVSRNDLPMADSYPPAVVRRGDYLYMYYADYEEAHPIPAITVARLAVSEIGRFPHAWEKYYQGSFQEPASGGRFTAILPEGMETENHWTGAFPSVSYSTYLQQWLMVHCGGENPLYWRTSKDGLHWSEPQILARDQNPKHWYMAPTVVGLDGMPGVSAQEFYVYYAYAPNERAAPGGWMVRRRIRLQK